MKLKTALLGAATAVALSGVTAQAERGADGHLNIIYWQAASILNPFLSGGTKDTEASSMVIEPLARYDEQGNMLPWLVDEIPTVANGGISEDLTTITWKLTPGIKWSDGSDFTAADVVFTGEYCMHPEGGCQQESKFAGVKNVEALDDLTVKITFDGPKPFPYAPFVGVESPIIQAAQFANCLGADAPNCTEANFGPHGTGPFRVTEFKANDVISYEANPHYRDPAKPAFATATFKGGGDAAAAARSVLETGEFDYAWNLQIDPTILTQMAGAGKGTVVSSFGTSVERLMVNLSNPDAALGDKRSTLEGGPHPFLTDPIVRTALSKAIDRALVSEVGYGAAGKPTCNVLPAPAIYASTANDACLGQDIAGANAMLEGAGWVKGADGIRAKDGVRLSILYQTSTNAVRQDTQALLKQWWSEIGVETELKNVDAGVFFGGDQSSPDTYQKLFADIEMYTNNFAGTDPEAYMGNWVCDEIPMPSNNWLGSNMPRYCDPAYDALAAKMGQTSALEERAELAKAMNDMLMQAGAMIPLVHRGDVSAHSNTLNGVKMNSWDSELWNVADWTRAD
ncbi:peptide ABC transporter substrate-binding protein [Aliiroseovarius subalbicans]|uniref:peptide ABC transporter substrate-binding protein n=1 Tax=Aliiroseovarius subalbicans TaxID=2925840 RepID=UPI001F59FF21|nr:peptide ABC transporter substrate-binding protein [Aliiroseovarius subalbicans]MCI2397994.1 peptide ABC transporter substrate-binding protein [Aliiroseovarius subalbicans]